MQSLNYGVNTSLKWQSEFKYENYNLVSPNKEIKGRSMHYPFKAHFPYLKQSDFANYWQTMAVFSLGLPRDQDRLKKKKKKLSNIPSLVNGEKKFIRIRYWI